MRAEIMSEVRQATTLLLKGVLLAKLGLVTGLPRQRTPNYYAR